MTTVTIPKKLDKNKELIAIPRKEYEAFSKWQKMFKEFKATTKEQADLKKARADYKAGRIMSINEFKRKLAGKN